MQTVAVNHQSGKGAVGPSVGPVAPSPAIPDGLRSNKFGSTLVSVYIFLIISRVLDLSPIWWLHIPMILMIMLYALTLFRGQFRLAFASRTTVSFALFTAWVVICLPMSYWRGASMQTVIGCVQAFTIFIVIVQMLRTMDDWRRFTGAYAYAVLVAGVLGFYFGRSVENGRLALLGGSFGDPNEYALGLVLGLPFWWHKAGAARGPKKIFYWACTVPIFMSFARTGSRSGLFALLALFVGALLFARGPRKLLICAVAGVAILAASAFLPDYLRARYFTIFTPDDAQLDASGQQRLNSDIASSEGRKMLLIESIHMTFEHPIFGVGPGVFSYANWDQRKANTGVGGLAQVTHNTYTQISSETGLPGFLLFVTTIVFCFKSTYSDYRAARTAESDLTKSAQYLIQAFIAMAVGIFFLSVGYTHFTAVLFAMAVSLHNLLPAALSKRVTQTGAPQPPQRPQAGKPPATRISRPTQLISPRRLKNALSQRRVQS